MDESYNGANIDNRTEEEKQKDWNIIEAAASIDPVIWEEIPRDNVRSFGVQNQDGQSSCVANTRRKLRRIMFKVNNNLDVDFSAGYMYRKRSNFPAEGMGANDAISIDRNNGMTINALMPTDNLTEAQVNALVIEQYHDDVAKVFTITNELIFTPKDFLTPCSTIQKTRKGVMMWFFFKEHEFTHEVPVILDTNLALYSPNVYRHSVTGIEPAIYNGQKGVWIEDSAHFGGLNRRFITEEFYMRRNFWASYPINMKYGVAQDTRPKHIFTKPLVFIPLTSMGTISNIPLHESQKADVIALQDILKYEGLFSTSVASSGYFGAMTAAKILAFQKKYAVAPNSELDELQGKRVGAKTIQKLNELYGT